MMDDIIGHGTLHPLLQCIFGCSMVILICSLSSSKSMPSISPKVFKTDEAMEIASAKSASLSFMSE